MTNTIDLAAMADKLARLEQQVWDLSGLLHPAASGTLPAALEPSATSLSGLLDGAALLLSVAAERLRRIRRDAEIEGGAL